MMGLRSLFPKKEIRYRADSDTVVNVMVSSKEKKRERLPRKHVKKYFLEIITTLKECHPWINSKSLNLVLLSKTPPLY